MSMPVIRRPKAKADVEAIADHIARDNLDAAVRFMQAVEVATQSLCEFPKRGRRRPEIDPTVRAFAVPGFRNYILFYYARQDFIDVVRVIHGAMDLPREFHRE